MLGQIDLVNNLQHDLMFLVDQLINKQFIYFKKFRI